MHGYRDEQKYREELEFGLMYIWKCYKCGHTYRDYPGTNEAMPCDCGGYHEKDGESHLG